MEELSVSTAEKLHSMGDQTRNKRGTDGEGRERKHRSERASEHGTDPAELCCWTVLPAAATQSRVTGVLRL